MVDLDEMGDEKNLDDMADTVADVGPDHDLREALHGLLLDYLQSKVRLEDNYFVLVEYCFKKSHCQPV